MSPANDVPRGRPAVLEVFDSGGDVRRDLAAVDWAATPLGPPDNWPQSLVSVVRVLLTTRFSMWMAWGPDLTFFCNDAYRRDTLGRKYPWALGRPASEVWAEVWPEAGPRIEHVMSTGEATWDERLLLFLERNGYREESYHTFSYSPLDDDDGKVVGMLCVVSEDTERVIGAREMATVRDLGARVTALRSEEEVLDAVSTQLAADPRSVPWGLVYVFEGNGSSALLSASPGVPAGHPVAVPVVDAAAEPGAQDAAWPVHDVLQGRTVLVDDLPGRFGPDLPSGAWPEPPLQALAVPLRQQGNARPAGFLVAALNRYRALDADYQGFVELLADQISSALAGARAYREERERAERLLELDRAKTEFFTNISHEFRTPLTLLLGPAEDALADTAHALDEVQRQRFELVRRNGERLLKLVNTLLDFSRLEDGSQQARFEAVDLAQYTTELARTFTVAIERAGLNLTVDCPPLPAPVLVDREMWAKIVLNLLSNALKFTFTGGITVRLRAGRDGRAADEAVLEVEDTGVGIAPEHQGTLFARFSRVAGAVSRSHEGSGIGLALVSDLTAAHGGRVGVRSAPGEGSTFSVAVPLGRDHLPAGQVVDAGSAGADGSDEDTTRRARGFLAEAMRWSAGPAPVAAGAPGEPADDRPTVLVADDNADMRDYIVGMLQGSYHVLAARDGQEALEVARAHAPDLVLSDVMMPRLDGFALLRALRDDPLTARTPVVLLSARAGEEATVEGLEAGADDYLVKPFSTRELLARVKANLELERVRRSRRDIEASRRLLDEAQRLAGLGSWQIDVATGAVTASQELARQLGKTPQELDRPGGAERVVSERVHPDDRDRVRGLLERAALTGEPYDDEQRHVLPGGEVRIFRSIAEVERNADGRPVLIRGSNQDVTVQREAERAVSAAAAAAEAAAREHKIASELQRGLLPDADVEAEALRLATYYRAGVEGTQVGGDWYDVIELGARRTALVLGDVMGRGVRAAAVMGQLRSAVRAYARLDLPPADVLEHLDGVVRELGEDQIVTCIYAVFDPYDRVLTYANAGHLPPLVRSAGGSVLRLPGASSPPLGAAVGPMAEERIRLEPGDVLALYTDGLVERRDIDIDAGVDALALALAGLEGPLRPQAPDRLMSVLLPDGPDDDVALLLAQPAESASDATLCLPVDDDISAVGRVRHRAGEVLAGWSVPPDVRDEALLLLSELTTNALLHGRPPVEVRLSRDRRHLTLEVHDGAPTLPRRSRPEVDDEHGRGLLLVSLMAQRWGTRPTPGGKAVWCVLDLPQEFPAGR
jgi:signal transduction histidine kinase/DNA-binding response OmpR family regulator/anti-sigma regulatory factor (Ser/Thr protein kinase)